MAYLKEKVHVFDTVVDVSQDKKNETRTIEPQDTKKNTCTTFKRNKQTEMTLNRTVLLTSFFFLSSFLFCFHRQCFEMFVFGMFFLV